MPILNKIWIQAQQNQNVWSSWLGPDKNDAADQDRWKDLVELVIWEETAAQNETRGDIIKPWARI